jgi:hypothetical protein
MFEHSDLAEVTAVLADPDTPKIALVYAANRLKAIADAIEVQAIADLAIADGWEDDHGLSQYWDIGPRLVRVGADGTGLIDETLPLEIAAARKSSVGTATWLIRDVVNLKARHPSTWQSILEGRVPLWQGQRLAQICTCLDKDQAIKVDDQVHPALGVIGYRRLTKMVQAAIIEVAPQMVEQRATARRYLVRTECDADASASCIEALVDTADAIFFDSTIDRIADLLGEQGDTRDKDHRRAAALGVLATPALALSMLGVHTRRGLDPDQELLSISAEIAKSALPKTQVYVHLSDSALEEAEGVARIEDIGPALVKRLSKIVGHSRIRLTPVVHTGETTWGVDQYEIPSRIRQQVILRDRNEVFPYSSREARHQDLDHVEPYRPGVPNQTRASNLGALSRRAHRAKTHHPGWELIQTEPGVFWWRTGLGQLLRVGPEGTTNHTEYFDTS